MVDVIVVGAGFSGSLVATMLSQNGYAVTLIDRYQTYPEDFRAEQLVGDQIGVLQRFGVLQTLVSGIPLVPRAVAGRRGKIVIAVETPHYGLPYASMVARLRKQVPQTVQFIVGRVTSIEADGAKRRVSLDDGSTLSAPLVVLATGMNPALPDKIGVRRTLVSAGHSLAVAFDMTVPRLGQELVGTYYGNTENRIDYITVFPFEGRQRANLFMYAQPTDQGIRDLQANPASTLRTLMPQLETAFGEFTVTSRPVKRMNDIWVSEPSLDGVVVVGDAFQTPCPAAGTGISRLVSDVDVLCHTYIPAWLSKGSTTAADLLEFYRDPAKVRADRQAMRDAEYRRAAGTETSLRWQIHRKRVEVTDGLRFKLTKRPSSIGMVQMSATAA